jgi:hypothetical protein
MRTGIPIPALSPSAIGSSFVHEIPPIIYEGLRSPCQPYSRRHRRYGVFQIFYRHVTRGMPLSQLALVQRRPMWLAVGDISVVEDLGGHILVQLTFDNTVLVPNILLDPETQLGSLADLHMRSRLGCPQGFLPTDTWRHGRPHYRQRHYFGNRFQPSGHRQPENRREQKESLQCMIESTQRNQRE